MTATLSVPTAQAAPNDAQASGDDSGDASLSATAAPAEPDATAPAPAAQPRETPPPESSESERAAGVEGPVVLDGVLPCGLHVVVGRDTTLPVAAIVLAVETGTEDDPSTQPGLVHALAYQLLQGNRELAPGGAAAIVNDGGGISMLAIGPAQIRYESLVPASRMSAALWAEAQRLQAPTVNAVLWADSLRWAARDKPRKWSVQRAALAVVHDAPGLEHQGRSVDATLSNMTDRAIANAIAQRFTYSRATLAVVAPGELDDTWSAVQSAFADLPDAPRIVPPRLMRVSAGPTTATAPRPVLVGKTKSKATTFVWPVAPTSEALLEATVWCKAVNRQRKVEGDGARARVRCSLDLDPRRGTLVLRSSGGTDPEALVGRRLARLEDGTDDALIDRQRQIVLANDRIALRTPLALARRLTAEASVASPPATSGVGTQRSLSTMVGHAPLVRGETTSMRFGPTYSLGAAILLTNEPAGPGPDTAATQGAAKTKEGS